ncbi:MAG TPA: extracellular solute-binding protein [Pseudomonadales bacterium]|nr:extracellular solute-binding protein [Pseudomonadales bacterium]
MSELLTGLSRALVLATLLVPGIAAALPDRLPDNLVWITNEEDPTYAAPEAKRGGTFRTSMQSFPLTLRRVGPDSNGGFAQYLRYNQMSLVEWHPNTRRPIPSLASHWAFDADGKTVYYRIDKDARWSDGVPVTAADFEFTREFMRSKVIVAPWYNDYYTTQVVDIRAYGDRIVGVEGAAPRPAEELMYEYSVGVVPNHFHQLTDNWVADYNWKIEPNTGPYQITDVRKGRYIELTRDPNWWANDRKYYQHRFNPDKIRIKVVRDLNVDFQHFIKGETDTFGLVIPQFWHDKAKGTVFDNGYVSRYWFYNDLPQPSSGMFLNEDDPILKDRNVRIALAYAMNFDKVIRTVLRNDYARMQTFNEGFGDYDNLAIHAREFDLAKARDYLEAAGWHDRGPDGILVKDGKRLSLRVTYGSPYSTDRLVVLREEAKKAGIELELALLDSASAFKQMQEKKHQIAWMTWASQGISPEYWQFFHSVNAHVPQTNNLMNHDDPVMDKLIDAYRASSAKSERVELAHQLEQMVFDSGAIISSFKVPYTREAAWNWVKLPAWLGTRTTDQLFDPLELSAGVYSAGGLFWIDVDEKRRIRAAMAAGERFAPVLKKDETYRRRDLE